MIVFQRLPFISLLIAGAALCGCGDSSSDPGAARPSDELIVAIQDDARTLDPHQAVDAASMRVIENLHSTLLRRSMTYGEFEPDLALAHSVSDDGMTYTFKLRPGVKFHSRRELSSADVKRSVERIIEKQVRADHFAPVESILTPDPLTVVFKLSAPFAPFLSHLANPMNAIVDLEALGEDQTMQTRDAGCGPFKLVERTRGVRTVLQRHEHYYDPNLPHLRRIIFRPLPDETARTIALRNGEVDLVLDLAAKDVAAVEGSPGVVIRSARPGTFWEYLGLNTRRPPFDDPRVRQAIAWAVDRAALNQIVKLDRATPIDGGPIRPGYWAYADLHLYPRRDIEKAKALLAEAGRSEPFSVTLKVGSAFAYQVDAAQVIKQQLRDLGIDVRIEALESSVFFDALGKGDFDMTLVGWVGFVDPDEWLYNIFHTDGKYNQQGYSNLRVDELLNQGRRARARAARAEIYTRAQRIITEDAPMVFLYLNDQTSAMSDALEGYDVRATASTLSLREARVIRRRQKR